MRLQWFQPGTQRLCSPHGVVTGPWRVPGAWTRFVLNACVVMLVALVPLTCESPTETRPCPSPVLRKCACEWVGSIMTKVNCTNTGFKDVTPLAKIHPTVQSIVFTGNTLHEIYPNIMGTNGSTCRNMPALTALDLSRNNISLIHGKAFHCMKQLEVLIMDDNRWGVTERDNTRTFSSLINLKTLHLRNALAPGYNRTHLKQVFIDSFAAPQENNNLLEEIRLEDNHLRYFHTDLFCGLNNLRRIYLSRNNISTPQINEQCVSKSHLEELHLDHNNITFFSPTFLQSLSRIPSLKKVTISNNPFQCDCNFINSYRWLKDANKSHFVHDKEDLTCSSPTDFENVVIMSSMTEEDLKVPCQQKGNTMDLERARKVKTSYIILGIIFAILGVLFIAVLYLNRFKIQRKLHVHIVEPIRESMLGKNMHYGYASVSV